ASTDDIDLCKRPDELGLTPFFCRSSPRRSPLERCNNVDMEELVELKKGAVAHEGDLSVW
ncbi:hypothetical protein KXX06_006441, partial [Aspergillus fumigatus]